MLHGGRLSTGCALNKETANIMLCWLVRRADLHFLFAYKTNRESHDVYFFVLFNICLRTDKACC